jgi:hypothetical protein
VSGVGCLILVLLGVARGEQGDVRNLCDVSKVATPQLVELAAQIFNRLLKKVLP